jgi:hypothetical protein
VGLSHKPGVLSIHLGESAAYDAFSEGGRFADWLEFAPDLITWTERAEKTGIFRLFQPEFGGI